MVLDFYGTEKYRKRLQVDSWSRASTQASQASRAANLWRSEPEPCKIRLAILITCSRIQQNSSNSDSHDRKLFTATPAVMKVLSTRSQEISRVIVSVAVRHSDAIFIPPQVLFTSLSVPKFPTSI